MGKAYFINGEPKVGKTTVIKKIIELIGFNRCGGFYTEEIKKNSKRVGFRIITLDNQTCTFAHINSRSQIKVGKYGVDLNCLEEVGIPALNKTLKEKKLVIVDEVGPMELVSDKFRKTILKILNSPLPLVGTIVLRSHPWADELKNRKDVKLYHLTVKNRESIVRRVVKQFTMFNTVCLTGSKAD